VTSLRKADRVYGAEAALGVSTVYGSAVNGGERRGRVRVDRSVGDKGGRHEEE